MSLLCRNPMGGQGRSPCPDRSNQIKTVAPGAICGDHFHGRPGHPRQARRYGHTADPHLLRKARTGQENGRPTERYQRYHEEKVKGGRALTMLSGASTVAAGPLHHSVPEENRDWGYDRIAGALANLGYEIWGLRRLAPERKRTTT